MKMSVTGSMVGKSQKMQLRDEANAADTNTSGELTFSSISKVSAKIYFFSPLKFIDKIESNFLWIKWMKVRCPGPGSCTRCSPHSAAKV